MQAEEWLAFARQAVAVDTAQSRIEVALHYAVKSRLRSLLSEIRRASSRASTAQSQRRSTRPQSPARNESSRAMSPLRLDALAQHSMSDALDVSGSESETGDGKCLYVVFHGVNVWKTHTQCTFYVFNTPLVNFRI